MKQGAQRPHTERDRSTQDSPTQAGQARPGSTSPRCPRAPGSPSEGCSAQCPSGLSHHSSAASASAARAKPTPGSGSWENGRGVGAFPGPARTFCPSPSPRPLSHVASGLGLTLTRVLSMAHYAGVPGQAGRCVLWGSRIKAPNQQRKSLSVSWRAATGEALGACCGKQAVGMVQPSL